MGQQGSVGDKGIRAWGGRKLLRKSDRGGEKRKEFQRTDGSGAPQRERQADSFDLILVYLGGGRICEALCVESRCGSRGQDREAFRRSLKSGGSQLPVTDCQITILT